jgi:hypothetical protein
MIIPKKGIFGIYIRLIDSGVKKYNSFGKTIIQIKFIELFNSTFTNRLNNEKNVGGERKIDDQDELL